MNQKANTKREFPYVKLVLIVTLVLVVAIVGFSILDTVGIIAHMNTAAKSDNFKFNENIVDVYRYIIPASTMSVDNFCLYALYGGDSIATSMESTLPGLGRMCLLFQQSVQSTGAMYAAYYSALSTSIELGYFDYAAYAQTREVMAYCEGAREAGLYDEYKKEIAGDIDEYIEAFEKTADSLGITLRSFMSRYMGDGVSKKDVRKALEYQFVAGKFAEKLQEDYENGATTDELKAFIEDNKTSFYTSSYYSVTLATKDLYDAVAKAKSLDEVKSAIVNYYFEKNYKTEYDKQFGTGDSKVEDPNADQTKADILTTILAMHKIGDATEVFTSSETDAYKKAARKVATSINSSTTTDKVSIKSLIDKIDDRTDKDPTEVSYVDLSATTSTYTDLQKWLFDSARKQNDFKALEEKKSSGSSTSSTGTTTTTTYTLYIAEDIMELDTEKTKVGYYLTLTDDKQETETTDSGETVFVETESALLSAGDKAQAMYDALKGITDKDEFAEKFAELVEKYAPSTSTYYSEMLTYKDAPSKVKDWFYDEDRKEGDLALLPLDKETDKADKTDETETTAETETETEAETEATTEAETSKPADTAKPVVKDTVAYFVEENKETWEMNSRTGVANEKRMDWLEAAYEKYNIDVDYKFPSTETEAGTTAATKAETTATTDAVTKKEDESKAA